MVVCELPFGTGRAMNPGNMVARALVSGWRLSSITRIRSGLPYGIIGASYNPSFSGPVRINGDWGSGDLPGVGAYGLYSPGFWNEDAGVVRQFGITERFKLDFSAAASHLANAVIFSGPAPGSAQAGSGDLAARRIAWPMPADAAWPHRSYIVTINGADNRILETSERSARGLTFGALMFILHAGPALFRTGWFVESVISASVVVLVIRTRGPFFRSRPGKYWSS